MAHIRLVVIGASGRIGREVARLGVAYGAEVIGVDPAGPPVDDEPWVHGVKWERSDGAEPGAWLDGATGVVIAAPIDPRGVVEAADDRRIERIVLVSEGIGIEGIAATDRVVHAAPDQVDDSPLDPDLPTGDNKMIRVERLGMALLRAAIDENIAPSLDHESLCTLGDAMFWQ